MAFRLAVVCLAVILSACGGGGGGSTTSTPQAQWGRSRADQFNTGNSPTGVTNTNPAPRTSMQLNGGAISTTPAVGADGSVFVATETGGVFALEPHFPTQSPADIDWQFNPTPRLKCSSGCALALDGFNNSFFGTDDGFVFSLDDKGALLWQSCTNPLNPGPVNPDERTPVCNGAAVIGSPILVIDTVLNQVQALFVATSDGRVLGMGGQNGQIRWTFPTNGEIKTSPAFDGLSTIYAPSAGGLLYTLTLGGTPAFPASSLGAVDADFTAAPSLFGQVVAQSGLAGAAGGRVRGYTTGGVAPIWDRELPAAVRTSLAQYSRVLNQRIYASNGTVATGIVTVTDYVAVDAAGAAWLLNPQLGTLGTRCIGGVDDLQPCRDAADCSVAPVTPGATPLPTPNPTPACLPPTVCNGGDNAGITCRTDTASTDCPGAQCVPATTCQGGSSAGATCNRNEDCPGGTCNLFSVNAPVDASPVTTAAGTIFVVATPEGGPSTIFAIEPPNTNAPVVLPMGSCRVMEPLTQQPDYCTFAYEADGIVRSSPSIASDGTVYFGDDTGVVYAILTSSP